MNGLAREGYVVVPTGLVDAATRGRVRTALLAHFTESPEFDHADPTDSAWRPVLGGFAACGNPSSFHHPFARRAREVCLHHALHVLPVQGRCVEVLFDRIVLRRKGQSPTAETVHRDETPAARDGDDVFGGWLNTDDVEQTFVCAPRTHTDVGTRNYGFAKVTDEDTLEAYAARRTTVAVPPGHMLLFYERILHEVTAVRAADDLTRVFVAYRLTHADSPLFGEDALERCIAEQAVPKIKSGQDPALYPSAYRNFPRHFDALQTWSVRTFAPAALYRHTVRSGRLDGATYMRVLPKCPSLARLGRGMHTPYDADECALLRPQRAWNLHVTFDASDVRRRVVTVDQ